jgi:hypothetical protein
MVKGLDCLEEGGSNPGSGPESGESYIEPEALKPAKYTPFAIQESRTRACNEGYQNCGILCFTLLFLILCVISFVFCQQCLFMILIVSACLCPFFHPMNAPLWLAIVLLTVGGWNFTVGALTVTWNYRSQS